MSNKAINEWKKFSESVPSDAVLDFVCPHCSAEVLALKPPVGDVWDSTTVCPYCEGVFIKIVKHDEVEALTFIKLGDSK